MSVRLEADSTNRYRSMLPQMAQIPFDCTGSKESNGAMTNGCCEHHHKHNSNHNQTNGCDELEKWQPINGTRYKGVLNSIN